MLQYLDLGVSKVSGKISTASQIISGAEGTEDQSVKEITKDTAKAALSGAAKGAVTGGAVGAAAGAGKEAAISLAKNKRVRKLVFCLIALAFVVPLCMVVLPALAATALITSISQGKDANTSQSVLSDGLESLEAMEAARLADEHQLPWTLVVAAMRHKPDIDLGVLSISLQEADPGGEYFDLTIGGVYTSGSSELALSADRSAKEQAQKVEDVYVTALIRSGASELVAKKIFLDARKYALGQQCDSVEVSDEKGHELADIGAENNSAYTPAQVEVIAALIGVAKYKFDQIQQQSQAGQIALAVSLVESGLRNLANDGVVGSEDTTLAHRVSDFEKLKFSLTLPHDGVGSDHSSLGVMQQQAFYSWGDQGESTFSIDHRGVIRRLMTPSFAGAVFFDRLAGVQNWDRMEPGEAAGLIQVSAFNERYAERMTEAEQIWNRYAPGTPALASESPKTDVTECKQQAGINVPTGDESALAKQILAASDRGEIVWFAIPEEGINQVKRYANAEPIPEDCTLDKRILQTILIANELFDKISVNSLNRRCTGDLAGAGKASKHWQGKAVDFGFLAGGRTTGADAASRELIVRLDAIAPGGSKVGQLDCRGGVKTTERLIEFNDTCHHLHFDLGESEEEFGILP